MQLWMRPDEFELISGWVDRAFATETVNTSSIPGRVKPIGSSHYNKNQVKSI